MRAVVAIVLLLISSPAFGQGYRGSYSRSFSQFSGYNQAILPFAIPVGVPVAVQQVTGTYSGAAAYGHFTAGSAHAAAVPQNYTVPQPTASAHATSPCAEKTAALDRKLLELESLLKNMAAAKATASVESHAQAESSPQPAGNPADPVGPDAAAVLKTKCASCHNPTKVENPQFFDADNNLLAKLPRRKIYEAVQNRLDAKVLEGSPVSAMPPTGKPALSQAEVDSIYDWASPSLDTEY